MAVAGSLVVNVIAKTGPFKKGLGQARGQVKGFSGLLGKATSLINPWTAAIAAGTAAVGGLVAGLTSVIARFDDLDKVGKVAAKLGMTTQSLMGLQHAAALSGVKMQSFNIGLQRMTRRVAEAAKGTGETGAALVELGLDAQKLGELSPDQQFLMIAEAMKGVTNQADRVRLGFKLFDAEGVDLINTMHGGAAGLEAMMNEAQELGAVLDGDGVDAIEAANDSMTRIKATMTGLRNSLAVALAPALEQVAKVVQRLVEAFTRLSKVINFERLFVAMLAPILIFTKETQKAQASVSRITSQLEKMKPVETADIFQGKEVEKRAALIERTIEDSIRGQIAALKERQRLIRTSAAPGTGAVLRGTGAAFGAIQSARRAADPARKIAQKQLEENKKQVAHLENILHTLQQQDTIDLATI